MTPWTDLGGGVLVRQSRVFWMNSALLLDREHAVLVDPGVLPSELDDLAAAVRAAAPRAVTLVFTHAHWDHVLGRPWWPGAATVGHGELAAELRREAGAILEAARRHAGPGEHPLHLDSGRPRQPLTAFTANEARFSMLRRSRPEESERLGALAQHDVDERRLVYEQMAEIAHEPEDQDDTERTAVEEGS